MEKVNINVRIKNALRIAVVSTNILELTHKVSNLDSEEVCAKKKNDEDKIKRIQNYVLVVVVFVVVPVAVFVVIVVIQVNKRIIHSLFSRHS